MAFAGFFERVCLFFLCLLCGCVGVLVCLSVWFVCVFACVCVWVGGCLDVGVGCCVRIFMEGYI